MMDLQTEFGSSTNSMLGRPKNNQDIMYESACTKLLHGAFNEEAFNTALKLFKVRHIRIHQTYTISQIMLKD